MLKVDPLYIVILLTSQLFWKQLNFGRKSEFASK